jgi:hypothetical protein
MQVLVRENCVSTQGLSLQVFKLVLKQLLSRKPLFSHSSNTNQAGLLFFANLFATTTTHFGKKEEKTIN